MYAWGAVGAAVASYRFNTDRETRHELLGYVRPPLAQYVVHERGEAAEQKREDLKSIKYLDVKELWSDCGQMFDLFPQEIGMWEGVDENDKLFPASLKAGERKRFPPVLLATTKSEPLEHLRGCATERTDSIVSSRPLNKIDRCDELFTESYRVLRPGGMLVCWRDTAMLASDRCSIPRGEEEEFLVDKIGYTEVSVSEKGSLSSIIARKPHAAVKGIGWLFPTLYSNDVPVVTSPRKVVP